jgi:hypothetical protein
MQVDPQQHLARPFLIHHLAADFELLDVWRIPARSTRSEHDFERFLRSFPLLRGVTAQSHGPTRLLFALRTGLLRVFGKSDEVEREWPIPGCQETSLRARLSPEERAFESPRATRGVPSFLPIYATESERLYEISNATVHALLHISWIAEGTEHQPYVAVYAKTRGWFGRFYMALIAPFRHLIVYPALMKSSAQAWQRAISSTPPTTM